MKVLPHISSIYAKVPASKVRYSESSPSTHVLGKTLLNSLSLPKPNPTDSVGCRMMDESVSFVLLAKSVILFIFHPVSERKENFAMTQIPMVLHF